MGLWRRAWLQKPVENISCVVRVRSEYGALWIMTVRQTNHFLFDIALSFPVSSRFWMPLIPFLKNELTPPKTLQSSFKLKKSSKNATTLIFFPVKAEMLLFSNLTSGGHQGGHRTIYFDLKFWKFCFFLKIMMAFKIKILKRVSARCKIWKEQHLSFHWKKKLISYRFSLIF